MRNQLAALSTLLVFAAFATGQRPVLHVDRSSGVAELLSASDIVVDGYTLKSPSGLLDPEAWQSLTDQGVEGWSEANPRTAQLSELNWEGNSPLSSNSALGLGALYNGGDVLPADEDLSLRIRTSDGTIHDANVFYSGSAAVPTLTIDQPTGMAVLSNPAAFALAGYSIGSASGVLNPTGLNGLADQGVEGWNEASPSADLITELNPFAESAFDATTSFGLGQVLQAGAKASDITFDYVSNDGVATGLVALKGPANDLVLEVNLLSGEGTLKNMSATAGSFDINAYNIASSSGGLSADEWNSLSDQGTTGWTESSGTGASLAETLANGTLPFTNGTSFSIGNILVGANDLVFEYTTAAGTSMGTVEYVLETAPVGDDCQSIAATRLGGDVDGDGTVAFADFLVLSTNFGEQVDGYADGDIDCSGDVAFADFLVLSANFGQTAGAVSAVPEPSSTVLSVLGALGLLGFRPRNSRATPDKAGRKLMKLCVSFAVAICTVAFAPIAQAQDHRILFHGSGEDPVDGADGDVFDFLVDKLGENNVVYMQGDMAAADGSDADGFDVLVISSTLLSGTVRGKYADAEIPLLNWEQALKRAQPGEFNLSNGGATVGTQFEIDIVDNTHFITEGFDLGFLETTFLDVTYSIGRGEVGEGVQVLANLVDAPDDHAIMVAERGAKLLGNGSPGSPSVAPERRATLFLEDEAFFELTDEGLQLFDRTIDWLLRADREGITPGDFNSDGNVDFADFLILADNFGTGSSFAEGDFNEDGEIDLVDFGLLKDTFAAGGEPTIASVPEPDSLPILGLGVIGMLMMRRRKVKAHAVFCVVAMSLCLVMPTSEVQAQRVLFHGSGIDPIDGADGDVFDFLVDKLGEGNVEYMQGAMAADDGSSADGFDALIISATLNSGTVRGKYADLPLPVLNWEQALMRAQPGEFNLSNGGATPGGQFEIDIIDNTHFITEGLDLGFLETTFVEEIYSIGRGAVGDGVQILANLVDVPDDHAIMVAERGAALLGNGSPGSPAIARERRATLFLQDNTFAELTDEGLQIFDRTIDWLFRADLGCPCEPGDFNADGEINFGDFLVLANNFGAGTQFNQGDNNFDGVVDLHDFFELRQLLTAPVAQAAAVPEPNGLMLLVASWGTLLLRRRPRSERHRVWP